MIVDTGASTDIMDETTFTKVNCSSKIELQPTSKSIIAYGSQEQLTVLGQFDTTITFGDKSVFLTISVLKGNYRSLLSYQTALDLNIIDVHLKQVQHAPLEADTLIEQYPELFKGIGKLKDVEVKLHIDSTVKPVAQSARRIPFHMRKEVATEVDNLG